MAVSNDGYIYNSANSGTNWTLNTLNDNCIGAASSAKGNVLVTASTSDGYTAYYSTNSGAAWRDIYPQLAVPVGTEFVWSYIASSADGTKLAVSASAEESGFGTLKGFVFTSTNSGNTWIGTNNITGDIFPAANWNSVALSADGTKLIAVAGNGLIYTSTDTGITCKSNLVPALNWTAVASSADGAGLVAVANNGSIYTSANSGLLWRSNAISGATWTTVASSADGTKLVAASGNGLIYRSTNSGVTWQASYTLESGSWASVASSADGCKLVAAADNGGIYTLQLSPQPSLKILPITNVVVLSWLAPSLSFQVQQKLSLSATNWQTLTNIPQLNLTNLLDVVTLTPTNNQAFFRLVAQ